MSPVSRPRKRKNRTGRKSRRRTPQPTTSDLFATPGGCTCPECADVDFDPAAFIDDLTADATELTTATNPLDVEVIGATFVSITNRAGEDAARDAMINAFIPALEAKATTEAVTLLLAIASVAEDRVGKAARTAAERLVTAGVRAPRWMTEFAEPVVAGECWRFIDSAGTAAMLLGSFQRAGRTHGFTVSVNHSHCGAADDILLLEDEQQLSVALKMIPTSGDADGLNITQERLEPSEFRWHVENALAARAVHDQSERDFGLDTAPDDNVDWRTDYPSLAILARAWTRRLPEPTKPPAAHPHDPSALVQLLEGFGQPDGTTLGALRTPRLGEAVQPGLPANRKKSAGPAPLHQIKVGLRGAKPPIWRRLEVPADITLADLHTVIQAAFGWHDCHLHVFETPYGKFGVPDADLGHGSGASVTLEQVAPSEQSKIRYTYDFGDDWEHDIAVEKITEPEPSAQYPRCTGGRRAAPPEDCGGIWGYADLIETLTDPTHPQYDDRVEWLGLTSATDFDPAEFDMATVNRALTRLN